MILVGNMIVHDIRGSGDLTAVQCRGGNGAGIHQADTCKLSLAGLRAFAVGEVAGGVAEGQAIVGGDIARAEAGTAEAGFDDGTGLQQRGGSAGFGQFQTDGNAGGIDIQREVAVAAAAVLQNGGCFIDVVEEAAGTTGNHALISPDAAVCVDLVHQADFGLGKTLLCVGFQIGQNGFRVF